MRHNEIKKTTATRLHYFPINLSFSPLQINLVHTGPQACFTVYIAQWAVPTSCINFEMT